MSHTVPCVICGGPAHQALDPKRATSSKCAAEFAVCEKCRGADEVSKTHEEARQVEPMTASGEYEAFITEKLSKIPPTGLTTVPTLHPSLFPHQKDLVAWALRRGRAAVFAATGLGKMRIELAWADAIAKHTGGRVLILAPLAVASQLADEGSRIEIRADVCREPGDSDASIVITNYDRIHKFNPSDFVAFVADESSCIKHFDSATFRTLRDAFRDHAFRLCATATPSPNDYTELGTHAELLGVCTRSEMLAEYFVHDGANTAEWRIKGHARDAFWRWVATWGALVRMPSDLGYDDGAYVLPALRVHEHIIRSDQAEAFAAGRLFVDAARTLTDQRVARRASLTKRVAACAKLVNAEGDEPWIVWGDLNDETQALAASIDGAIEVRGSQSIDEKEAAIHAFLNRDRRVVVSKQSIMGWGLNLQFCARMAFVGVNHSWEAWHQAVRRAWRFGQTRPVDVHVFASEAEADILKSLQRKERDAVAMGEALSRETCASMRTEVLGQRRVAPARGTTAVRVPAWLCTEATDAN